MTGTPPGKLRAGDHVRLRGSDQTFVVVERVDTALVKLRSRHGVELKAGWRALERVEADIRSASDPAAARSGGTVEYQSQHPAHQCEER